VVHRDVKPANILIASDHRVKLVDLGTATAGHMTQITAENQLVGTLSYIAPERLAGDSVGEPAADVYALAVVAFEALTGRPPRTAQTPGELLDQMQDDSSLTDTSAWRTVPTGVRRVLAQGMLSEPSRRQGSAGALVRDLEAALPGRGEATSPHASETTAAMALPVREQVARAQPEAPATPPQLLEGHSPPPVPAERRSRSRWIPLALACLAAGVVALILLGGGDGRSTRSTGETRQASNPQQHAGSAKADASGTPASALTHASSSAGAVDSTDTSASGAELNQQGYSLLQQGRYAEAIPVLRSAVAAFPEGTTDINYAYALFNLGHALRLDGQPEKAIPILERRLQIPDQTETVRAELEEARAAAGE
jgi:serine/threonine-protein kinase